MDLRKFKMFDPLTDAQREYLKPFIQKRVLNRGTRVSVEACEKVSMVRHGLLKVFVEDGVDYLKYVLKQGDVFSLMPLLGNSEDRSHEVLAVHDSIVFAIEADVIRPLFAENPDFLNAFHAEIAARIKKTERYLSLMHVKSPKKRLLKFLETYIRDAGAVEGDYYVASNIFNQEELARLAMVSRQTASTFLSEFRKSGLIEYDRENFRLRETA